MEFWLCPLSACFPRIKLGSSFLPLFVDPYFQTRTQYEVGVDNNWGISQAMKTDRPVQPTRYTAQGLKVETVAAKTSSSIDFISSTLV